MFQVGEEGMGRNLISVIPHWLEVEIHQSLQFSQPKELGIITEGQHVEYIT